ncbi:MAG: magnesium/cobalt transporter CorA [Treponema sp.]|nr:magnesium/cobalt transporter CorA [Treponema sp.]
MTDYLPKEIDLPPGSPFYIGDRPASEMDMSIIVYDSASAQMRHPSNIEELIKYKDGSKISWINISGLKDIDSIKHIGDLFGIHPLSIEDILHTEQQPKIETFDNYRFLSVKTIQIEKKFSHEEMKKRIFSLFKKKKDTGVKVDEFIIDQVSIILMENTLITFQEIPGDPFDRVRRRILEDVGEIRNMGTEYLAYAIIDAVVDEYFLTLNHLEDDIENFEERAVKTSDDTFIQEIQDTKKYLLLIKRAITPMRENLITIIRRGIFFKNDELKPFLQDLNENLNHAIIMVENHREWLSNIMDVNLSVLSHQMNKVMKVLATISTIFIPLTFIAGIYGMNFSFMPELEYKLGYPIVLGGMVLIAIIMIIIFKRRRWF